MFYLKRKFILLMAMILTVAPAWSDSSITESFLEASSKLDESGSGELVVVSGISLMPVILSGIGIDGSVEGSTDNSTQSKKDEDDQFFYINALDEKGNPVRLKLPNTAKHRVTIMPTDKVAIKVGNDGERMLYVNGKMQNLFLSKDDTYLLKHERIE